jgi:3-oxoacyl-[acyl-carrier protein] reductase
MKTSGKVAVVTGASRGIGRAIALGLARDGFQLAINYRRQENEARLLAEEIRNGGGRIIAIQADLEMPEAAAKLARAALDEFGQIDVLVNNAGTHLPGVRASEVQAQEWNRILQVNLTSPFLLIQEVLPPMRARRSGVIINLSSNVVHRFPALSAPYTVSKCGLDALTRILAKEEGVNGIRINSVAPGPIETDMLQETLQTMGAEKSEAFIRSVPLQRLGRPEDIAEAVRFLVSDKASYITGQVFFVNGGGPGSV